LSKTLVVESLQGSIVIVWLNRPPISRAWTFRSAAIGEFGQILREETVFGFQVVSNPTEGAIILPHWSLAAVVGALGAVPCIKNARRFSLRALLLATTLVAVFLGAIIYALR
jgi:hypothetical protein